MDLREEEQKKFRKKKRRHWIAGGIVVVIIVVLIIVFTNGDDGPEIESIVVERGVLIQEVNVTGRVVPADSVDLAFERSGRISRSNVDVGDVVVAEDVLAQLSTANLWAQLLEAQANEAVQQANLDGLKSGTRPEDIAVKEAEFEKAEQDLSNDYDDVLDTLEDAYATADDAVRVRTSSVFTGTKTSNYTLTFTACSNANESLAIGRRLNSEYTLDKWRLQLNELSVLSSREVLGGALDLADGYLATIRAMLESVNSILTDGCAITNTNLNDERTAVNIARANITTDIASISALQQSIASQKLTVVRIENELSLKRAGSTPEAIRAQEASLLSAQARVQSAQAEFAKASIRAPFAGVVTEQGARVGEIVAANTIIVSLISEAQFEIDASIPEVDIIKMVVGDVAIVTLDAYGDDVLFEATLVEINPAERIVSGVPVYDVTLQFSKEDERIRSGMTANVNVLTDFREDVIAIPSRAIVSGIDGRKIVRLLRADKSLREVFVETGLRGSDGRTEILSGINEGDTVVTFYLEE